MTEVTEACRSLDWIVFDEVSVEAKQKINCQNVLKERKTISNMYINLVLYEAMPTFLKYPSMVCSNRITTAAEFMAYDHYPWTDIRSNPGKEATDHSGFVSLGKYSGF